MLDEWLKTLEQRQKALVDELQGLKLDESLALTAHREININARSVRNYLTRLAQEGYSVTDDLKRIEAIYLSDNNYKRMVNHLTNHMIRMRKVVEELRQGCFESEFI